MVMYVYTGLLDAKLNYSILYQLDLVIRTGKVLR